MRVTFKAFDSKMASREKLFKAALDFANKVPREDLINITHTEDRDNIVVTIWYFTGEVDRTADVKAKRSADVAGLPAGSNEVLESGPTRTRPTMMGTTPAPVADPEPAAPPPPPAPPVKPVAPVAPALLGDADVNVTPGRRLSDQIKRIIHEPPPPKRSIKDTNTEQ